MEKYVQRTNLPTVNEIAQLFLDTMMNEMERNNGIRIHQKDYLIKETCSCGSCHLSYLLARKIHGLLVKRGYSNDF